MRVTSRSHGCERGAGWRNYVIPKIDVQVSGIMRSMANVAGHQRPGDERPVAERQLQPAEGQHAGQLGRPLAGDASQVTLDLVRLGDVYPVAHQQRWICASAKIVRFGRFRANVGFDLYNLFNANPGIAYNQNFGTNGATWLRPNSHPERRDSARFNATVDF